MITPDARMGVHRQALGLEDALNSAARVACLLCGASASTQSPYWGCQACGSSAPLSMVYAGQPTSELPPVLAAAQARRAFALFTGPVDSASVGVPTPLTHAPRFGRRTFLKQETFSLTHSHKDRYQAVASQVARLSGCRGVVASSTGNHGASAAAHAARVDLPSVVFCHQDAPEGLLRAIGAFGGVVAQLPPTEQRAALVDLVREGWFPATSMDPVLSGAGNPYAAEGYKEVAWEIVEQLGMLPDAVFIPTAGGDTFFGIAKGLAEVAGLSGMPVPHVYAIQPEGANALSQSLAMGQQVMLETPNSVALSIADAQSGRHALAAITTWNGGVIDVSEAAILAAITDLASAGIYTDPASAAAMAGYRQAVAQDYLDPAATAVLVLTSSGFKWPNAMEAVFSVRSAHSLEELHVMLATQ